MPNTRGRDFCKYCYTTFYIAKADVVGRNFFSVSHQIKVNGITFDEYILPYHFIIIIPNWFTKISWSKQPWVLDFSNLNVANYVKRFEQVIQYWYLSLQTSRRMQNKFRLVGGDFLSEKKENVVGHEHFWDWSSETFFLLKFWFWIIRVGKSDDQDINLVWP